MIKNLDTSNDVSFIRLRTKKHEVLIAPGMKNETKRNLLCFRFLLYLLVSEAYIISNLLALIKSFTFNSSFADKEYALIVLQSSDV